MADQKVREEVVRLSMRLWRESQDKPPGERRGWRGCHLVNPLCPDDLCQLPSGHVGTVEGYHVLGTDRADTPRLVDYEDGPMYLHLAGPHVDQRALIQAGADRAYELWPEHYDNG